MKDYAEYLASELWQSIRIRVFERDKCLCRVCGLRANQVHHMKYDRATIKGVTLKYLISICGSCHTKISLFSNDKKRSAEETKIKLMELMRISIKEYTALNGPLERYRDPRPDWAVKHHLSIKEQKKVLKGKSTLEEVIRRKQERAERRKFNGHREQRRNRSENRKLRIEQRRLLRGGKQAP